VTVEHQEPLSAKEIQNALEEGGFDVCDVSPDDSPAKLHIHEGELGYLDRILDKWTPSSHEERPCNLKKHIENCELCRQEAKDKDGALLSSSTPMAQRGQMDGNMEDKSVIPLVIVDSTSSDNVWQATLAVGGMTCAACVTAITEALDKKDWIRKVTVNLSKLVL
jgi:Cu+-exporting ATPase